MRTSAAAAAGSGAAWGAVAAPRGVATAPRGVATAPRYPDEGDDQGAGGVGVAWGVATAQGCSDSELGSRPESRLTEGRPAGWAETGTASTSMGTSAALSARLPPSPPSPSPPPRQGAPSPSPLGARPERGPPQAQRGRASLLGRRLSLAA